MKIDCRVLETRVRKYLASGESDRVWDDLANSILFNVVGSLAAACVGLVLVCTLVFAKAGIQLLYGMVRSFVTFEVLRSPRAELMRDPEKLRPLILATVIAGPRGHALALGSFSPETQAQPAVLARKAAEFADLYAAGSQDGADRPLIKLLKDDGYVPYRRRPVPSHNADGHELVLFDMELDLSQVRFTGDKTGWVAATATIDEPVDADSIRGRIAQIPWAVVRGAVVDDRPNRAAGGPGRSETIEH